MELNQKIDIRDYLDIAWRRKWFFIIPFILSIAATVFYIRSVPNIYQASTLILVEPQKVPPSYIKPTVTDSVQAQLRTITEQIMSRTYLEKVIKEFNLYSQLRQKLPFESVIEKMRTRITVRVKKGRVFSVSFEDENPVIAMKVANRLAFMFIEENLKVREEQAEGTLVFLEKELNRMKSLLKQQEKAVLDFRAKHLGVLPEQLDANLRTLDRLQLQLQNTNQALQAAIQTKLQLQNQLAQARSMADREKNSKPAYPEKDLNQEVQDTNLKELKKRLAFLELRYTDQHPEVIRLRRIIQKLEKDSASQGQNSRERIPSNQSDTLSAQIERQLSQINEEIAKLQAEKKELQAKIKEYQKRVEITPKVEQQLKELSRGYEVTKKQYQSLLDKRLQAELAANMERKQKGEQFKILDPAKLPEKPYKPNRPKLFMLGLMLGLGVGFGIAFLVEYMDHSFYKVEDLEKFSELPVLACIPEFKVSKKKRVKSS